MNPSKAFIGIWNDISFPHSSMRTQSVRHHVKLRLRRSQAIEIISIVRVALRLVHFLDYGISINRYNGQMVVTILSAVAQAERQLILGKNGEKCIEAKSKGVKFGRKPTIDRDMVYTLREQGLGATNIA